MQALRKIYHEISDTLTIPVPAAFQNGSVEIIMLPLDETTSQGMVKNNDWPPYFFEKTAGCLADDPIERAPQGDYEIREVLK
ncbi:MAG: hypothetical protein DRR00_33570 [Candidatus Parabeggiatoa sp. nov. 3]|jgi:hypothetical protein|nr:MAG: hypothetical protein DRR00_33570 [Gammaproteobacteria bacterium]